MYLEQLLENLAEHMPTGWSIRIEIECGAGNVMAIRPDGSEVNMGDGEMDLSEQVSAAYHLAVDEMQAAKLDQSNTGSQP